MMPREFFEGHLEARYVHGLRKNDTSNFFIERMCVKYGGGNNSNVHRKANDLLDWVEDQCCRGL